METKHTKGEWEIRGNKIFIKNETKSIATVHVQKNYKDITFEPIQDIEAEANAKLIAFAPELLECTERLLIDFIFSLCNQAKALGYSDEKSIDMVNQHNLVIKTRATIRKATE